MNKKLTFFFIYFLLTPLLLLSQKPELPFVVVIPSYNNKNWYQTNLDSVFNQKYQNYRVIYVADAPTDGTADLVEEYVKSKNQQHRFTLIRTKEYNGPLACTCQAAFLCDKNEIIVDLDGNDWLAHPDVLSYLNKVYSDPSVWMTYGQFTYWPDLTPGFAKEIPLEILQENNFRSLRGVVTDLKTFYAGLFQAIEKQDFFWAGNFIPKAGNLAYVIPILEMSQYHTKLITDVLYFYNKTSPVNENKLSNKLETNLDQFIRNKKKYFPVAQLPIQEEIPPVYQQITNIYEPTQADYQLIQDFLATGKRNRLERLHNLQETAKEFKIIGSHPDEIPFSEVIPVNCDLSDKENCIIIYAAFNKNQPQHLKRLLAQIAQSNFKGHILYHLGGWPNIKGGSLTLAHVPSAHRVSSFMEAKNRGYKRALWLDPETLTIPEFSPIFGSIQEKGYFAINQKETLGNSMNIQTAAFFGLSLRQTSHIPLCSTSAVGIDFSHDTGKRIIDWWLRAALDKDAFYTRRTDQGALSIIFYKLGIALD